MTSSDYTSALEPTQTISHLEPLAPARRDICLDLISRRPFTYSIDETRITDTVVKKLSDMKNPEIYSYENFLSSQECDVLIALAKSKLEASSIVCDKTGERQLSNIRTSQSAFFERGYCAEISAIEARIGRLLDYPITRGEDIQVAYYNVGQEYRAHHDYFDPNAKGSVPYLRQGGQRFATVLMYLNNVLEGGGTKFPKLGLTFTPRKGCALLFVYANAEQQLDDRCLHAGTPVLAGEKWIATKWLRFECF